MTTLQGRVHNGVVVLQGGPVLPEGMEVTVSWPDAPNGEPAKVNRRVDLPLVRSNHPGTLRLTAEQIANLLEVDDVSA